MANIKPVISKSYSNNRTKWVKWCKIFFKCADFDGLTPRDSSSFLWLTPKSSVCSVNVKSVQTSLKADVTFSSQTNPTAERFCWLLTDSPREWDRAGGESTQNANHLVAADWITPLFMHNSPERPAVGICQGRRSCRSFIRPTMEVSLLHHIIWLPACAASTMTHNHLGGQWLLFNQRHASSLLGVWF